MIIRILAAALVVAAPLAAAAQTCPTGDDVETGVQLTRTAPFFSVVFTQTENGLAEARVQDQGGVVQDVDTVYQHPLAVSERRGPNGNLSVNYARDPAALDDLPALRSWSSDVALFQNGDPFTNGTYTATVTGFGTAQIGPCSYDVWRVRDSLNLDTGTTIQFEKSYAPDLGLVVGSIQLDPAGQPTGSVFFDRIAAE